MGASMKHLKFATPAPQPPSLLVNTNDPDKGYQAANISYSFYSATYFKDLSK